MKPIWKSMILAWLLIIGVQAEALAATTLEVELNKSKIMQITQVTQVAVANPDIADVVVAEGQVLILGKKTGATSLKLWSYGNVYEYEILVQDHVAPLTDILRRTLGYADVTAFKEDKNIILTGTVDDQDQKLRAEEVAKAYGEKVVNLLGLTHNTQVKIEAKVVEISRSKLKQLGVAWGHATSIPGVFSFGQSSTNTVPSQQNKLRWLGTYADINGQLNALVQNGTATVLSQPNVITNSGSKAHILVGGEIPVPVSADNSKVTVEWKSYGIKLYIEPSVGSDGMITSNIKAEVSSLDFTSPNTTVSIGGNYVIPALRVDQAETVIRLASGQPMVIGGLISAEKSKSISKLPILGDLPLIGYFFKNQSTTVDDKELIIVITPTLITDNNYEAAVSDTMKSTLQQYQKGAAYDNVQSAGRNSQ